ncbi:MAG TPA: ABC transporter permease [Candidatus Binatia bacterium]|jgi:NitT/TauT family transport system permease protein|nr:ABC transporter permease [Candidatus Binatia bacterium]
MHGIIKFLSILGGLVLWHILATRIINDTALLISPLVVVVKGYEMLFVTADLYPHLYASSSIFLYGMLLATLVGVPVGFVMALSPVLRDYLTPWMTALYTTPRIAFAPVLLLWFGIDLASKIIIVFLGCVFPILINSFYGMRVVSREFVEVGRSFRLSRGKLFLKILLPASVPFILAGLRLAVGRGLTGVAIAEWFGATEGLGHLIFFAGQTLNIPILFVGVAVFAILGILGFQLLKVIEELASPWRKELEVR